MPKKGNTRGQEGNSWAKMAIHEGKKEIAGKNGNTRRKQGNGWVKEGISQVKVETAGQRKAIHEVKKEIAGPKWQRQEVAMGRVRRNRQDMRAKRKKSTEKGNSRGQKGNGWFKTGNTRSKMLGRKRQCTNVKKEIAGS
eukprot:g32852.t1